MSSFKDQPSKRIVKCGVCKAELRRDELKLVHFPKYHPGIAYKDISCESMETDIVQSHEFTDVTLAHEENKLVEAQKVILGAGSQPQYDIHEPVHEKVSNTNSNDIMEGLNSVINMLNEHKICQLQKHNETLKELQEHSEKLNELKELKKNKEKPNVTEVGDNIERDILVKNAKDIDKLVGYAGMTKFEELKQLICDMCHHELVLGEKSETHKNKGHGVFHYDFQLHGSDFNGKSQAREFINLKSHIANHLMSKNIELVRIFWKK